MPRDRSFVTWEQRETYGEHFTLNGEFNYWSDSEVLRDFRHREFDRVQQPDSFVEAAYTGDNYSLSAFGRFHPNRYYRVQERLPELRFDVFPVASPLGFYSRLNASAAVLQSDAFGTDPRLRTTRFDAYYGLERPIAATPWVTFNPVAGGRVTHYTDALGGKDQYTRTIGEVGFDARLLASGVFDVKNAIWEIVGLRHLVEPKLSYRYAPEAAHGRAYIPPIDEHVFSTYLQPLSIADSRNLDDLTALNTARFSLNNTLQTRDAKYGSRNLARSAQLASKGRVCPVHTHVAPRAAAMNALTRTGSFRPGSDSTPLETSSPYGRTRRTASAAFSAFNPPASSTIRLWRTASAARSQLNRAPVPPS